MEFGFFSFLQKEVLLRLLYSNTIPQIMCIYELSVSLNVNQTTLLVCSNPIKWFPISLGIQSKLLRVITSLEPSILSHLAGSTLFQQYWLFFFFFIDRPDFFCFKDLYLVSLLPRRNLPQISRTHPLTLFRFLPT